MRPTTAAGTLGSTAARGRRAPRAPPGVPQPAHPPRTYAVFAHVERRIFLNVQLSSITVRGASRALNWALCMIKSPIRRDSRLVSGRFKARTYAPGPVFTCDVHGNCGDTHSESGYCSWGRWASRGSNGCGRRSATPGSTPRRSRTPLLLEVPGREHRRAARAARAGSPGRRRVPFRSETSRRGRLCTAPLRRPPPWRPPSGGTSPPRGLMKLVTCGAKPPRARRVLIDDDALRAPAAVGAQEALESLSFA